MTKPTDTQIEALGIEAIKDELDFQRSKGSPKADGLEWALNRLAAEVGEQGPNITPKYFYDKPGRTLLTKEQIEAATIERCAKVAESKALDGESFLNNINNNLCAEIAAAIRALKDKPQPDPNIIYPGKDLTNVFPEE